MNDPSNSMFGHHPGRGFEVCHVAGHLGQQPHIIHFEDLRQTRAIGIPIEGDHMPPLGQESLDHPGADEAPRPGDQHHIPITHAAMLSGLEVPSDRLTPWW